MARWIGLTLRETLDAIRPTAGGKAPRPKVPLSRVEAYFRITLSAVAFSAGIGLQFAPDPTVKKLGATIIGLVLGYWLR